MKVFIIQSKRFGEQEAIVDDEDAWLLEAFKWRLEGSKEKGIYLRTSFSSREKPRMRDMFLHHAIAGRSIEKLVTDHINGNKLDNRKQNLRFGSLNLNSSNRLDNKSGISGVCYSNGYWHVESQHKNKRFRKAVKSKNEAIKLRIKHLELFNERVEDYL